MSKIAVSTLVVCLAIAHSVFAQGRQIVPASRPIADQYIVVLAGNDDPTAVAAQTSLNLQGRVRHVYRSAIRGFSVRLNRNAAVALANDPRVLYVEEDGRVDISDAQEDPPWGLDRIDSRALPLDGSYSYPPQGTTVHVHVIDTGIRASHVEFEGRASVAFDYVDDDNDGDPLDVGNDDVNPVIPDGADCHGHGTHVAGTIGGVTYGVAKHVMLYAYRALDCSGEGTISAIIAAIDDITLDLRRPAVVNMSLRAGASNALDAAVRRSIAAGMTYVVAAGNDTSHASNFSPSRVAEAITVGATNATDSRVSWSNFGAVLDVFAPGANIRSAWYTGDTTSASLSGTSMAAPHATGVAALYLGQHGHRSPAEVRNAIVAAATPGMVGNPGPGSPNVLLYSSFGESQSEARLNVALAANGGTATASSFYNANFLPGTTINGDRIGRRFGSGGGWRDKTPGSFPDWLDVAFSGSRTIDEVAVFSLQDNPAARVEPTVNLTFSKFGVVDFTVQYWTGAAWQAVPNGVVRGNALVWRSVTFPPLTTTRIRVLVERTVDGVSRLVEVEAYEAAGVPGNVPPVITLTAPANGSQFTAPASIPLAASASDDSVVEQVAFYANGVPINTDTLAPYSFNWTGVAAGTYTLTAVATDDDEATTTSAPVVITVNNGTQSRVNVALATNGGIATASTTYNANFLPSTTNDGDRTGRRFGSGGGWSDKTPGAFPDWLEVAFSGQKNIDEVSVFSLQDNPAARIEPTTTLLFTKFGVVDFTVQYWTGAAWQAVPNGIVRGNARVWRSVTFPEITTTRIRVLVERTVDGRSRLVEVEAWAGGEEEPPVGPVEWFVAPGGTGSGTSAAPFGSVQAGLNAANPGDIVTVRPGTYAERLQTVRNGAAGQPIRLRAAGSRGSVVVTAPGRVLTVNQPYFTVEGLVLDGQYGADDAVRVASAAHFMTLRNVEIRRSSKDLIDMGAPAGVLIESSLIHHALNAAGGRTDAHGIVAGAVRDFTVRQTEIHTFSGDGIQVDAGRSAPGWNRVTIEDSHIWLAPLPAPTNGFAAGVVPGENGVDTKASPSFPRASITIRNTIVSGFRAGLIANMAAFNLKENIDASVDRVTVYNSEIAFRLRGPTSLGGAWVTVKNAVIHDVTTAFRYEDDIQVLNIWNVTLGRGVTRPFQAASSGSGGLNVRNLLSIGALSAEASNPSNLQVGTSAFVDAAAHDYRLAAGSPAIDAGVTIAGMTTDRAGVARPQGSGYDVGAYEWLSP